MIACGDFRLKHPYPSLRGLFAPLCAMQLLCGVAGCIGPTNTLPAAKTDITIAAEQNDRMHVPVGQAVTYAHNPPASGPHWSGGTLDPFTLAPAPDEFY